MLRSSGGAARAGEMGCLALPLPPELPELSAGLTQRPRVIRLVDLDSVSHGLARGAALGRDLVILGGQDHIYAPLVRRLRLLGIPTWLVVPGRQVAASLYSSSCAVSYLPAEPAGPRIPAGPAGPPACDHPRRRP